MSNARQPKPVRLALMLIIGSGAAAINGCAVKTTKMASTPETTQVRTGANNQQGVTPGIQKDWKTVTAPIADLTLTLPAELSEGAPYSEPEKNGDVTWTDYSYEWTEQAEKRDRRFDVYVLVTVTNWDNGFPPEAGGGSPEAILERRYAATEPHRKSGEIEELTYLELDGVKGIFMRGPHAQDKDRIQLYWSTYRYHKNKAQHLSIVIQGARSDSDKLMTIINSVKLAQK